ncbi:MAG: serine hydrolase [Candidatus Levybacteria bacterium]|nr:serine hydrolase [Candidatus Levybacteria bacterium]
MKNLITILIFIFILLLIGRNLTFLPTFSLFSTNAKNEKKNDELKIQIQKIIDKQKGSYSVYYADFNSGDSFGINERQMHTGASVNKLPIIATLYYLANKGDLNLDEKVTLQEEDIQDYGTGKLRYEDPGSIYSLRTLAMLSLKESDNTAAYIIATKIGTDKIQKTIEGFGLTQTGMENNKTTVFDMFLLLKKIYRREIAKKALSEEFLGFLTDTETEDRLPLLMPKDVKVYHKTGDETGNIHDVGIIEKENQSFYLGVMTSDIGNNENQTNAVIGKIAKTILDYKTSKK